MSEAIAVQDLVKTFGGGTRALDGLDLSVTAGEVHGFLGPNGSGKSTTIRVLLGLLRATPASVRLLGGDPVRDAVRAAPPARVRAGRREPVAEPVRRRGDRPVRPAARRPRPAPPGRAAGAVRARPDEEGCRTYSKGNRQKVALVAAFASDVELYILDEPTSGLDPLMEAVFQECVREVRGRGPHRAAVQPHPAPRSRRCATG